MTVRDTRDGCERVTEMDQAESSIYCLLDDIITEDRLRNTLCQLGDKCITEALAAFEAAGLLFREGDQLLGLALQDGFPEMPISLRAKIFRR